MQTAFTNFFAEYPNFRKKHHGGSAEFIKSAFKWKDGKVFLAKCTQASDIRWSRLLPVGAEPSTITLQLSPSGRWMVSMLVETEIKPLPESPNKVGIDLGITSLGSVKEGMIVIF